MDTRDKRIMNDGDQGRPAPKRSPFGVFASRPGTRPSAAEFAESARGVTAAHKPRTEGNDAVDANTEAAWPDDAVEVGAVVDAYGLKGWVKVAAHADAGRGGDALLAARRWWFAKDDRRIGLSVSHAKMHGDAIVAHPAGSDDRDAALAWRGYRVYVRRRDFPALGADEFYWVDLIGLDVVNETGEPFGAVAGLIDNGVHAILRVAYGSAGKDGVPANGERLIPFVDAYVKTVDRAARRIVVDWQADY